MTRRKYSSLGVMLILALALGSGIYALDQFVLQPRLTSQPGVRTAVVVALSCGVTTLVMAVAMILLGNPVTRLLRRIDRVEQGDCPTAEEFTRDLHAEPLELAEKLQKVFQSASQQSKTDELTGLANRRQFDQALQRAYLASQRYHRPLSVMIADVDLFKAINDTGGHPAGDELLKGMAALIVECCRNADLPARLGGDEFAVLLPETTASGAAVVAERIRLTVADRAIPVGATKINATLSIGIADFSSGAVERAEDLVALADRALYEAKQQGRNRCVQAQDLSDGLAPAAGGDRIDAVRQKLVGLDTQFKALFVRALQEIVQMLERRDPHMADHARKVQHYAVRIARQMGLAEPLLKRVDLSALLHDIGMLALPDEVALCTGRLDGQQQQIMRRHPLLGVRILEGMELLQSVTPAVRSHHERFDGTGYPDSLAGANIPLEARIIAAADVLDAMTSPRSFRAAMPLAEALASIEKASGSQLDPDVVAALLVEARQAGDDFLNVPLPAAPAPHQRPTPRAAAFR